MNGAGLYVHVPYCDHKCVYCDFYSIESAATKDRFLSCLASEINLRSRGADLPDISTIFFGGGTPSLLAPAEIRAILDNLRAGFAVSAEAEVTLETNPGTVDAAKLEGFFEVGVNRLSIGVQSFDEAGLKFLTRIHSADGAEQCYRWAREAGFGNINLDFIFALPGQTIDSWRRTLGRAVSLGPEHLSAYCLTYEPATPLGKMASAGRVLPVGPDSEADFYEETMRFLDDAGYEQYEVSNFSRPGFRCSHNLVYWTRGEYLGFGPSAHSHAGGRRWWNAPGIGAYLSRLEAGEFPEAGAELIGPEERFREEVMLSLRMGEIRLDAVRRQESVVADFVREGLATVERNVLKLTRKGFLLCDELAARIIAAAG